MDMSKRGQKGSDCSNRSGWKTRQKTSQKTTAKPSSPSYKNTSQKCVKFYLTRTSTTTHLFCNLDIKKESSIQSQICAACGSTTTTPRVCGCWATCFWESTLWTIFSTHGSATIRAISSTGTGWRRRSRSQGCSSISRTTEGHLLEKLSWSLFSFSVIKYCSYSFDEWFQKKIPRQNYMLGLGFYQSVLNLL